MATASSNNISSAKKLAAIGAAILTAVGTISTLVFKFTDLACDLPALKWLLAIGLVFACGISYSLLAKFLARQKKLDQFFIYGLCLVLYVSFIVVVFTKRCSLSAPAGIVHQERSGDQISYLDNSVHQDNRKTVIHQAPPQKTLKSSDIRYLTSRLTDKNSAIFVQQLASRTADTLLQRQLLKALSGSGFSHVFPSVTKTLPVNLEPGRFTIQKDTIEGEARYNILINP